MKESFNPNEVKFPFTKEEWTQALYLMTTEFETMPKIIEEDEKREVHNDGDKPYIQIE